MIRLLFATLFVAVFFACDKEEIEIQEGFIYYSGSFANDRCGYVLWLPDQKYSPRNLSENINGDTLFVRVAIDKLDDFQFCGFGVEPLQIVNIRDLEIIN